MIKKKVVIISRNELSSWKSCQSIIGNLAKVYGRLYPEARYLKVPEDFNHYQAYKTANEIRQLAPDLIIWLDHIPNVTPLLNSLPNLYSEVEAKPCLLIHLFGDFVLDCLSWESAGLSLEKWPVHFLVASHSQKKLVESFFHSKESIVSVVPFPVDETVFNMNSFAENRREMRMNNGIGDEEKVFLFTGRISFQKNVELLIKTFQSLQESFQDSFDTGMHLWIAGSIDDILLPFIGKHGLSGSHYSQLRKLMEEVSGSVKFLGNCSTDDLVKVYHASDVFISMSTYNDEDYGMSPAEALCTGLPSLLSQWGGYISFGKYSAAVQLIPVKMESYRPMVDSTLLKKAMMAEMFKENASLEVRLKNSEEVLSQISLNAVEKQLSATLNEMPFSPVTRFSELFLQMCSRFRNHKFAPFKNEGNEHQLSDLYKEVYSVYCD